MIKRSYFNLIALSSFIIFFVIGNSVPGFGQDSKKVEIPIEFSKDETGKRKGEPKGEGKWEEIDPKDIPADAELLFDSSKDGDIKIYKVNPCYVCVGGVCYWKDC